MTGQRYLNHEAQGTHVLLFARESPSDDLGDAVPVPGYGNVHRAPRRTADRDHVAAQSQHAGEVFHAASVVAR